ncbi:hypothetical protein UFOVP330_16 [uncultured Caudovirales phage]|uniref:Uncharacterized protein n=1 Tax=uncultured Caudovirales phage TaxID=2100421 RepID=A0A6J5LV85_9CAUD|nr:hypothetical protein UFOVP330_16 [uncultured Caudovirales phage]
MADDLVKRLRDWPVTGITTHEAADRIGQLEQRLEATKDKAEAAILDLMAERDRAEARLDKAMAALREASSFLWHMTNAIDDEDYKGPHDGFNVPLVCHVQPYHDLHVEQLKTQAENVNAVLAEIEGGKRDE